MNINRRRLFALGSVAAFGMHAPQSMAMQAEVTSGGIGLTISDIRSLYEELPVGQSYIPFAEPQSGTELYIDFGEDDFARNIWVSGDLNETTAAQLITLLCPDDAVVTHFFEMRTGAGSLGSRVSQVIESPWMAEYDTERGSLLATYVADPGAGSGGRPVSELILSVQTRDMRQG